MADDLLCKIDEALHNPIVIPKNKKKRALFEESIDHSLGVITEGIDGFLKLLEKPWSIEVNRLIEYLSKADKDEVIDWINALEIVVVDRGLNTRWVLSLAQASSKSLALPQRMRSILANVLDRLDAAPWVEKPDIKKPEE